MTLKIKNFLFIVIAALAINSACHESPPDTPKSSKTPEPILEKEEKSSGDNKVDPNNPNSTVKEATKVEPTPEPSCSGTRVDGTCWYLGGAEKSCTSVCEVHGGYNEATRTFAGFPGGNAENCLKLLNTFAAGTGGIAETTPYSGDRGVGCSTHNEDFRRFYLDRMDTTADAFMPFNQRVCACNN